VQFDKQIKKLTTKQQIADGLSQMLDACDKEGAAMALAALASGAGA
jgi:hypothetical protein